MLPARIALGLTTALFALFVLGAGSALAAPPTNDNFVNASSIDAAGNNGDISQSSSNVEATQETAGGEQAPIIGAASITTYDHTIWHTWTAPISGSVSIDTCTSPSVDVVLSLYTGTALNSLTKVTGDVDGGCTGASLPARMTATVVGGTTYRIRIAGWQTTDVGTINLRIRTLPYAFSQPTLTGTAMVGETLTTNGGVWFGAFPQTKAYTWLTCADTTLGSCTPIATFAEGSYTLEAADAGAYLRVSMEAENAVGSSAGASVSGPVGPIAPLPPSNDNLANAIDLGSSVDAFQSATNAGASFEPGEPMPFSGASSSINSVWFKWTAPSSGPAVFSTCPTGITFDSVMAVYTASGSGFGGLSKIASDDDGCGLSSRMSTTKAKVTAGTTYWIQLATYSTTTTFGVPGPFTLTIALAAPNDDFADATDLGNGADVTVNSSTYNATREVGEPDPDNPDNIHTIWFKWTATISGQAKFDTCSSPPGLDGQAGHDGVLAVYSQTGFGLGDLSKLGSNDDGCAGIGSMPTTTLPVVAGTTYWVQVGKRNSSFGFGGPGPITLKIGTRPINISPSQISGSAAVGQTLNAAAGNWEGFQPLQTVRQWERCSDAAGATCANIPGATGSSLALTAADQGGFLRFSETVSNELGAAPGKVSSNVLGPVSAAPPVDPLAITLPTAKASKLKAKAKKGAFTLPKTTVTCAASATGACTGTAKLTVKVKKKTIKLGTIKLSFAKGSKGSIKLKLSKSNAKKLKGVKNGAASAVLSIGAPGFSTKTATVRFVLSG